VRKKSLGAEEEFRCGRRVWMQKKVLEAEKDFRSGRRVVVDSAKPLGY
jgi:hypothetical protein